MTPSDIQKIIAEKIQLALNGSFQDAMVYGTGYIRISIVDGDIRVEHVPFMNMDEEAKHVTEIKKYVV